MIDYKAEKSAFLSRRKNYKEFRMKLNIFIWHLLLALALIGGGDSVSVPL